MNKTILCLLLSLPFAVHANCNYDVNAIAAHYLIETSDKTGKVINTKKLNFWRLNKTVAYEDLDQQITEKWTLTANGQLKYDRYFDGYQRGIEYQPTEINQGKGDKNWSAKYQILDDKKLQAMKLIKSSGKNCDTLNDYEDKQQGVELTWLTHAKLPKKLSYTSKDKTIITWTLQELILDKAQIETNFVKREAYQLTDYADIGDNESDPFLLKMINLGFISHGASGIYTADGHKLELKNETHHH